MIMNVRTRLPFRLVGLGIFLLGIWGLLSAQSGRSWMKGIVLGISVSQGMSGAEVELRGDPENPLLRDRVLSTKTGEHGRYLFEVIPYGDYIFKVSAPGFKPYEIKIYILSDAETQLHVRLKKEK